jgi:hypothetical protein
MGPAWMSTSCSNRVATLPDAACANQLTCGAQALITYLSRLTRTTCRSFGSEGPWVQIPPPRPLCCRGTSVPAHSGVSSQAPNRANRPPLAPPKHLLSQRTRT